MTNDVDVVEGSAVVGQVAAENSGGDPCPLCNSSETYAFLAAPDMFHGNQKMFYTARCRSCSGVWLVRPPRPEQMSVYYDDEYHNAIRTAGETGAANRWRRHRELIARYIESGSLLDIGCSSGAFIGTMNANAWKLYGIELEASTAEKARAGTGAEVFVGDAMSAPFAAESFDVVTCYDLLEHVYDPRRLLAKVFEWLKPGGIFCTVLPNIDSWEARTLGPFWYGLELPRHLFHFSPRSLRYLMAVAGFREKYLATHGCYVERSVGYVWWSVVHHFGLEPLRPSMSRRQNVVWRAIRKALRISLVLPLALVASAAGAGGSIEAVFAKPGSASPGRIDGPSAGSAV